MASVCHMEPQIELKHSLINYHRFYCPNFEIQRYREGDGDLYVSVRDASGVLGFYRYVESKPSKKTPDAETWEFQVRSKNGDCIFVSLGVFYDKEVGMEELLEKILAHVGNNEKPINPKDEDGFPMLLAISPRQKHRKKSENQGPRKLCRRRFYPRYSYDDGVTMVRCYGINEDDEAAIGIANSISIWGKLVTVTHDEDEDCYDNESTDIRRATKILPKISGIQKAMEECGFPEEYVLESMNQILFGLLVEGDQSPPRWVYGF